MLVELTGWHRDYARASLRDGLKLKVVKARVPRGPTYGPRIIDALITCWAMLRAPGVSGCGRRSRGLSFSITARPDR